MSRGEKPYRVYRGGRTRGKVPTLPRPERARRPSDGYRPEVPGAQPQRRRRRLGWGRRIGLTLFLLVLVAVAWAVASYLAFRSGVREANERLDGDTRTALAPQDGLLLSHPTTILLLGTDHANRADRATARRSDSIMLVRTDPRRNRLTLLSIPRDLRVDVPGQGRMKINAAYQIGGPALATRTVRSFTGLPINHVATVDFSSFEELIDAVGGVTVDVPAPVTSKFECPYSAARCRDWAGWRFGKGEQELDGHRALVYSRIRTNELNAAESDITRGGRQQAVLQALTEKMTSPATIVKLPLIGDDVARPLTTDLTAWQLTQLGWIRFRNPRTLLCRLGGEPVNYGGESFIFPDEDNRNVISMFLGLSAPQPPRPEALLFGPGCLSG